MKLTAALVRYEDYLRLTLGRSRSIVRVSGREGAKLIAWLAERHIADSTRLTADLVEEFARVAYVTDPTEAMRLGRKALGEGTASRAVSGLPPAHLRLDGRR